MSELSGFLLRQQRECQKDVLREGFRLVDILSDSETLKRLGLKDFKMHGIISLSKNLPPVPPPTRIAVPKSIEKPCSSFRVKKLEDPLEEMRSVENMEISSSHPKGLWGKVKKVFSRHSSPLRIPH